MSQPEDRSFPRDGLDCRSWLIQSKIISTTTGMNRNPIENPVSIAIAAIAIVAIPSLATRNRVFQRITGAGSSRIINRRNTVHGDARPVRPTFTPSTRMRTTAAVAHKPAATRSRRELRERPDAANSLLADKSGWRGLPKPPMPLTIVRTPRTAAPKPMGMMRPVKKTVTATVRSSIWSPEDHLRSQFRVPRLPRGSHRLGQNPVERGRPCEQPASPRPSVRARGPALPTPV